MLLFFLLSLCELSFAQEQSDRDLITKTVHLYFDGMIERDKEKLEKAFLPEARLIGYRGENLT
ncbi:MAG TPA: dehydrogenase, partial [Algoriphagus sp.]|nr:dehydrogenase [Algoriphagus sp.]